MRFNILSNSASASARDGDAASSAGPSTLANQAKRISDEKVRQDNIVRDEEQYQAKQYPSFEDVPGCMQLFDEFMMCYALVPQLRSFYRQGEFRDCTWKWRDFKYCLSLKSESTEARKELWIKRRAEWWAKRRLEGSSEDVWGLRLEPPANFPPVHPEESPAEAPTSPM